MPRNAPNLDNATEATNAQLAAQDAPTPAAPERPDPAALDAKAMAAFDKGLEGATLDPVDAAPEIIDEPDLVDVKPKPGATDEEPDEDLDENGNPKVVDPDAVAAAGDDEEEENEDAEADEAAAQKTVDDEVKALGLKGKPEARFRELSKNVRLLARENESLKAYREETQVAVQIQDAVLNSGAQPEQFSAMVGYLTAVNSRDPVMMQKAFEAIGKEYAWLGQQLGKPVPGFNPLDADPALKAKVESGALDEADALEIIRLRQETQLRTGTEQQRQQQHQQQVAIDKGLTDLKLLGVELKAADPQLYAARLPQMSAIITEITALAPPQEWEARIRRAYMALPRPAAPAQAAPVRRQPLRSGGGAGNGVPVVRKPKNDADAFELGLETARAQGLGG